MAEKKVGQLIKEARTKAELSQEALASKIEGLSASDISRAERGEKDLTNDQLKQIAKLTGVTQKSLLEAPKNLKSDGSSSSKKTSSSSSSSKKKSSTASSKKTASSGSSKSSDSSIKLTAAEKKLVELYRSADDDKKKAAVALLKGETADTGEVISSIITDVIGNLVKK